jgi:tetratricopeptide (TPR) repeat protein
VGFQRLGNPIFLGALLVITLPLAFYRLSSALRELCRGAPLLRVRGDVPTAAPAQLRAAAGSAALWTLVVVVEAAGLLFTKSRGPFAGALVATAVFALALAAAWRLRWLWWLTLGAGALAVATLLGTNLFAGHALGPIRETSSLRLVQWSPATSGTSEVRLQIWGPALTLIARHPLLGCGPDALQFCYYPVYPTALRHIEAPNAVPDRTHNMFLDAAVETGLLGLAALLALLTTTAWTLWRLVARSADPARRALAAALLAALLGHVAEGVVGIAIVATSLLIWLVAAAAGSLAAMDATEASTLFDGLPGRVPAAFDPPRDAKPRRAPTGSATRQRPLAESTTGFGRRAHTVRWGSSQGASASGPNHSPSSRPRAAITLLCLPCLLCLCVSAWAIWRDGALATAADIAARRGAGLEQVALGNSGQAPVPPGVTPQPILALRQFAAAAADRQAAIRQAPDPAAREEYLLDAGNTLVEWAQAATQVGGRAEAQAPALYEQALADFGQAARLNPYNPDHLRNTGKAYERWAGLGHAPGQPATWNQEWLARAAQAFARAAALAPHHPDPLTSWAQVALWQGNTHLAQSLLARAQALDPRDGDAYRLRATAELAQGRRAAALTDWRRALADPDAGHPGEIAAQLALAEATWAHARCPAVRDARTALGEPDTPDLSAMTEIVHVDGPHCPGW